MDKFRTNRRDIQVFSQKNGRHILLHSEKDLRYSNRLEKDPLVVSYEPCVLWEKEGMGHVSPLSPTSIIFIDMVAFESFTLAPNGLD